MEEDLLDALQYIQYQPVAVPSKWEEDFGELNWLGPCCSKVRFGYGGKVYECEFLPLPQPFGITTVSINICDYVENKQVGCLSMSTVNKWDYAKGALLKHTIISIIMDFLKEHSICFYE